MRPTCVAFKTRGGDCVASAVDQAMKNRGIFQGVMAGWLMLAPAIAEVEPVVRLDQVRALEEQVEQVSEKVMPATVALISEEIGASGSGAVVNADGLILTAAHVTDGSEQVLVVFPDGKQTTGKVLGSNFSKDIGMVQIEAKGPWPFVDLGESTPLEAGDWVIAMGHSEGFDPTRTPPVRFGRVVSDGPGNFLTTDCELIGGDSGGPLFDLNGKLVGINSSIGESTDNNNHAGIDGFREDWDRLLAGEAWGELQLNPMANPERVVIGISMGNARRDGSVPVAGVLPGSPAAEAGLRPGDLIRSVNGSRVQGGQSLQILLAKQQAGESVSLGIARGGQFFEVDVALVRADQLADELKR